MTGNSNLNKILILDWDETITNRHMHGYFHKIYKIKELDHTYAVRVHKSKSDYNSGEDRPVKAEDIKDFLQMEDSGIKNAEQLKSVLQKALEQGVIPTPITNQPNKAHCRLA